MGVPAPLGRASSSAVCNFPLELSAEAHGSPGEAWGGGSSESRESFGGAQRSTPAAGARWMQARSGPHVSGDGIGPRAAPLRVSWPPPRGPNVAARASAPRPHGPVPVAGCGSWGGQRSENSLHGPLSHSNEPVSSRGPAVGRGTQPFISNPRNHSQLSLTSGSASPHLSSFLKASEIFSISSVSRT